MPGLKDRALAFFMRRLREQRHRAGADLEVTMFRKQIADGAKRFGKPPKETRITPVDVNGVAAEWVERSLSRAHRVILYFHGGGYCSGSLDSHRALASKLANEAHARVLLADYRLAPEHPFPAAFEDALACYRWLLASGIDPGGIVLAGDSAGGGLALAAAMGIRDEGLPLPAAIVGLSPWTDLALSGRSLLKLATADPMLDMRDLANFAQNYLMGHLPTDYRASPLYGDFHGLPSLLIHVGSNEVLKDDALRTAKLAEDAGVDVSIEVWDGMYHVFQALPVSAADASIARLGSFIRSRTVLSAVARPMANAGS
jgi:acetyl esterase/lipase